MSSTSIAPMIRWVNLICEVIPEGVRKVCKNWKVMKFAVKVMEFSGCSWKLEVVC